jgi:hypothetical protein
MSRKPILCLDFDGVLHSYTSKWQGADIIPDPPVPGMVEFLTEAVKVFDVQVYSTRSAHPGGIQAMMAWMAKYVPAEVAAKISYPVSKPPALVTIDDRAVRFEGVWPDIQWLRDLKPWNK